MAVVFDLLKKLNEGQILAEKLNIAEKIITDLNLVIPNRAQIVILWLFSQLENESQLSRTEYVLLWKVLEKSLKFESCSPDDMRILKSSHAKIILEKMQKCTVDDLAVGQIILSCVKIILQTPSMTVVFSSQYETLVLLLHSVLNILILSFIENVNDSVLAQNAVEVTFVTLSSLDSQNSSRKCMEKVFVNFAASLKQFALFFHFVENIEDPELVALKEKLVLYISSNFFHNYSKSYQKLLNLDLQEELQTDVCEPAIKLLTALHGVLCDQSTAYNNVMVSTAAPSLVRNLMEGFLKHNRNHQLTGIHVVAILSAIIGVDVPFISSALSCSNFRFKLSHIEPEVMFMALASVTRACSLYPKDFSITSDSIESKKNSGWLKNFCNVLLDMDSTDNKSSLLRCLRNILVISSSAIEINLPYVLKKTWFEMTSVSNEILKDHSAFYNDLLKTYSLLRQLPMFLNQFFSVMCDTIQMSSAYQRALFSRSINYCFKQQINALPTGQTTKLWQIFISTYEKLLALWSDTTYKDVTRLGEALFMTAEFFSTFLRNAKFFDEFVPASTTSKVLSLINDTNQIIEQTLSCCVWQNVNECPLCISILILCNAVEELQLASNIFMKNAEISLPFFNYGDSLPILSILKKGSCCLLGYLAVQLHFRKIGFLSVKGELTEVDRKHITEIISLILESAISSYADCKSPWDMEISSLNKSNYAVAVWMLLLKWLPQYMDFIRSKDLSLLCSAILDILNQENKCRKLSTSEEHLSLWSLVSHSMTSLISSDSKVFQSAFVNAVWKYASTIIRVKKRSSADISCTNNVTSAIALEILSGLYSKSRKCIKYASSTPKQFRGGKQLNRMWLSIQDATALLNNWLEAPHSLKLKLKIHETLHLLQVINSLHLVVLMPGNQIRCALGLSVLLLLLPSSCENREIEVQKVGEEILEALCTILGGVRSIWLFDFVHVKPYLKTVIDAIEIIFVKKDIHDCVWPQKILEVLFELSTKNVEYLLAIEGFAYELASNVMERPFIALACFVMLERMTLLLQRSYLPKHFREVCLRLAVHTCSVISKHLKNENDVPKMYILLVKCYTALLGLANETNFVLEQKMQRKWLKSLPNVIQIALDRVENSDDDAEITIFLNFIHRVCLCYQKFKSCIPENYCMAVWKALMHHFNRSCHHVKYVYMASSGTEGFVKPKKLCLEEFKILWTQEFIGQDLVKARKLEIINSSSHFMSALSVGHISLSFDISESEIAVLVSLVKIASEKEFNTFLHEMKTEWDTADCDIFLIESPAFQMKLAVFEHIIAASNEEFQQQAVIQLVQNCMTRLHFLLNQLPETPLSLSGIALPSLEFLAFVLKKEIKLPKQSIIHCLHSCAAVQLESYIKEPLLFEKAFRAVWIILDELMIQHCNIVLSCGIAFISSVTNLLKSVIKASDQDFVVSYNSDCQNRIQQCAADMDRLFISMTKNKREFEKMVPYIIADYVDLIQNITVHPSIKEHLVLGMNRLFAICSENSIKMLSVSISHGCREIYSNLVRNFRQYRYQGHV